jgi:ubiquinone biosynthesis protein COQ9
MMDLADATLDELRDALAPAVAANAAFDGWSVRALDAAADSLRRGSRRRPVSPFSGGAVAMIDAWFAMSIARCSRASRPRRSPR